MKSVVKGLGLSVVSFVIIGCGGGGSSSLPANPSSSEMAKITKDNSKKVSYSSLNNTINSNAINFIDNYSYENSNYKNFRVISNKIDKLNRSTGDCVTGSSNVQGSEKNGKVQYNNCLLSSGAIVNGSASIVSNEAMKDVSFNNFKIEYENSYIHIKSGHMITIGGELPKTEHLYMDIKVDNKNLSYFNFNYNEQYNGEDNNLIINGYVKTPCTGGYVKIETKPQISNYKYNPNGELDISSNGKTVKINFKGSEVNFTDIDKNVTTYNLDDFKNIIENNCSATLN